MLRKLLLSVVLALPLTAITVAQAPATPPVAKAVTYAAEIYQNYNLVTSQGGFHSVDEANQWIVNFCKNRAGNYSTLVKKEGN